MMLGFCENARTIFRSKGACDPVPGGRSAGHRLAWSVWFKCVQHTAGVCPNPIIYSYFTVGILSV